VVMLYADDGLGCAVTESCLLRVARMCWWKSERVWCGGRMSMLAFERGSEEVATNVRAFREGALCGPVKWLLVVDHFTLRRFKHSAYMYCVYIVGSNDCSV
jgi:hypothetical protein